MECIRRLFLLERSLSKMRFDRTKYPQIRGGCGGFFGVQYKNYKRVLTASFTEVRKSELLFKFTPFK